MPLSLNSIENNNLPEDRIKCADEAIDIFMAECREEEKKGNRTCVALAKFAKDETTVPLVFCSVDEAEAVKRLIIKELSNHNFKHCTAMVFKDGPYYHNGKRHLKLFGSEKSAYFLIKVKISAAW